MTKNSDRRMRKTLMKASLRTGAVPLDALQIIFDVVLIHQ